MKHAEAMLRELILHVRPPVGCAIVLLEWEPKGPDDQNWIASSGNMDAERLLRFNEKVAELRRTDRIVDWSDVHSVMDRTAAWLFGSLRSRATKRSLADLHGGAERAGRADGVGQ
jgi:hypothetical protein